MGTLLIDNIDVYAKYGVYIIDGSYGNLISYPTLKKPIVVTDWAEEDGEDPDLTTMVLDIKEFELSFFTQEQNKVAEFIKMLSSTTYHEFHFLDLNRVYTLMLVGQPSKKMYTYSETFSLRFADNNTVVRCVEAAPSSDMVSQRGYILDDIDLSEYGVYVLDGSDANILKLPDVKKDLVINNNFSNSLKYRSKSVQLPCLMLAKNLEEFWQNYDSLLFTLKQNEARTLYCEKFDEEYSCYYNSSSVSKFQVTDHVWCQFSLSLTFTSFGASVVDDQVLSTEDDEVIITEQGKYLINLNK